MAYLFLVEADTFGSGKTQLAARAAHHLRQQGFNVGGLLSVSVYQYRDDGFAWIGQDAILLPTQKRLVLARVNRNEWEARNVFPENESIHPRLTQDRRNLRVDSRAASQCLNHLLSCLQDDAIDAFVLDEVGTILGGGSMKHRDNRLQEVCEGISQAGKAASVVTVQLRGQHRQHLLACMDALKAAMRTMDSDYTVLDGLVPFPDLPPALQELQPA